MPVDVLQSSKGYDRVRLGCPWLMGFALRCQTGGQTARTIRSGDIGHVHVVTQAVFDAQRGSTQWVRSQAHLGESVSFLSGPHLAGRDSASLVFLIVLEDAEHLALRIATAPGSFEDAGFKMFRSFVTAQQQRAAQG
ncbi:hypothetical protein [Nioella nitratireducens]|uniref:hypothetical protein n=1 Tax=Nioella nitratireducens TaxID=1287720 RepID=UPI0011BA79A9|nr:hypothetical protein [Nioella nitratireducens]